MLGIKAIGDRENFFEGCRFCKRAAQGSETVTSASAPFMCPLLQPDLQGIQPRDMD